MTEEQLERGKVLIDVINKLKVKLKSIEDRKDDISCVRLVTYGGYSCGMEKTEGYEIMDSIIDEVRDKYIEAVKRELSKLEVKFKYL